MSEETKDGNPSNLLGGTIHVTFSEFCCTHCKSNAWRAFIMHYPDKSTKISFQCVNETCHKLRKEELGALEDEQLIWAEFDISNQGFDEEANELLEANTTDPNEMN